MDNQVEVKNYDRKDGDSPISKENVNINGEASHHANGMNGVSNGKVSPIEKPADTPKEKPTDEPAEEPGCMAKMCGGGEKKKEEETPMVGVCEITRFATGLDGLLIFIGCLCAAAHGASLPYMIIVFGDMIDAFTGVDSFCQNCTSFPMNQTLANFNNVTGNDFTCDSFFDSTGENSLEYRNYMATLGVNITDNFADIQADMLKNVRNYAIQYSVIGAIVLFVAYMRVTFWNMAAKRQAHTIRLRFFKAILRQNIGWFDVNPQGELNNRLTDDIDKIEAGIGDKLGSLVFVIGQTIACITVGFIYGWKLTLVIFATSPLLVLAAGLMDKVGSDSTEGEQKAYASAGAVAEEVVSSIRTVVAFGGQDKECERYNSKLSHASKFGVRRGVATGVAMGAIMFIMFLVYALGFWYGAKLIIDNEMTTGKMLIVFFSIMIAAFGAGQLGPSIQALAVARGSAHFVFDLIDRIPEIDTESDDGLKPPTAIGNITFKDVHFQYPSRPDVKVLQGLDLNVEVGKTVALVGSSGCGKSTTVQLIQRFYDIISGEIQFDGKDIRELNLKWLRSNIGIVSQEPILFATTIAENIRYGRDDVTDDEIREAARKSNAHDFISKLPQKYETMVGSRGAQLSGGQKQRIAIARALVHTPKVLLLDEATSALDTESEATVQQALEVASAGRTTIVIAHRLSTVQNADKIVAFSEGKVAEQGTHSELMKLDGIYAKLVKHQLRKEEHPEDDEEEELEKEAEWVKSHDPHKASIQHTVSVNEKELNRTLSTGDTKPVDSEDVEADEKKEEKVENVGFCELLSWNSKEWYLIAIGCFCALITGGSQPAFAVVFSKLLATFMSCYDETMRQKSELFSGIFVGIAFAMFIAEVLMRLSFAVSGERLTERIRARAFRSYLRQDISYYDLPENNTGAITTRLATETSAIQGATGASLGSLFNAIANIGVGLVIAFVYCWQLTLAILAFVPALLIAGFVEMKVLQGGQNKNKKLYEQAGKISVETIENIRTVQSLSKEPLFYNKYVESTAVPYQKELRMTQGIGLTYAVSQGLIFFAYAGLFYYGAYLINEKVINFEEMMITFSAVVFGAMSLGQAASFGPSFSKGSQAAGHIKKLENSQPTVDAYSTEGQVMSNVAGKVEFSSVDFHYPTRPGVKVLKELSVSVEPGQILALVGSSGCGKSTTVQLIERFYDSLGGKVLLNGADIKDLNVTWLRQQIGLVSQEPVLFDRSIADNIRYGANHREVPMDEVISAAQSANIHNFIITLPDGYDTHVGDKGTQLSGGQKQRVAIARALVRKPKILLLDEATSALDSESEKVVQEALDAAQKGRTSIVIAHRLSTIQNADKIAVIRHGHVSEIGTHAELMSNKGFYYKLQNIQKQQN